LEAIEMQKQQRTLLELWTITQEDFKKFISDRPKWFIDALEKARDKKGAQI